MNPATIIIVLIVLLVVGLPAWGYNRRWRGGQGYGYVLSGIIGLILLIVIILWLTGRF